MIGINQKWNEIQENNLNFNSLLTLDLAGAPESPGFVLAVRRMLSAKVDMRTCVRFSIDAKEGVPALAISI